MKLNLALSKLCLLSFAFRAASALLQCNTEITRSAQPAACAYFHGIDPNGYREWYDTNAIGSKYPNMAYLPGSDPSHPENGAAIHWKIEDEHVLIAVAARATGWLAFGIAEAGGMIGADMAIFTAARPNEIVDAYTTDIRNPQRDKCSNDWGLVSSNVDTDQGFIMFEAKRLLNTGDPQDKIIVNDFSPLVPAHRVISAWGDTPEIGYHGLNRARGAIRFFGTGDEQTTFKNVMSQEAEGSFIVRSRDHEIPANETEYFHTHFSRDDLIDQGVLDTLEKLNIIGFEPQLSAGTEAYVHHLVISASQNSTYEEDGPNEVIYIWAPGDLPLALPDNLGFPLFGEDGFQSFQIEIHYNNPKLNQGIADSSGVRVYWTSEPRDEELGIMMVGDPTVNLAGQPVGDGLSLHKFECPGECSAFFNQPVTVLREFHHMHQTGARMTNEQIRDGQVIRTGTLEYWDFKQNGVTPVQQEPYMIQPGDGFRTTCYFKGEARSFGLASSEEMCMAFMYYYPRTKVDLGGGMELPWICGYDIGFPACETNYSTSDVSGDDNLDRIFGVSPEECISNYNDLSTNGSRESSAGRIAQVIIGLAMGGSILFAMFL